MLQQINLRKIYQLLRMPDEPFVILLMRGYEDIGSAVSAVLHRYTQALQTNQGKLILAGVSPELHRQLQRRPEWIDLIGKDNIFSANTHLGRSR